MSDDKNSVLGAAAPADNSVLTDDALANAATAAEKSRDEIAAEEAKAEEEFLATPEDTVRNPLVPEEPKADAEEEISLEGAIGSGNLEADYPEEKKSASAAEAETPAELTVDHSEPAAPAPAPVEEPAAAAPVAQENAAPKKKSKKGLVITLIIIFLLLIGGGVAALIWFLNFESPENMLKDALSKFWSAENIQTTATVEAETNGQKVELTLDGVLAGADITGSGKIKTKVEGGDISIGYSAAYSKDGVAYFKLENLNDVAKGLGMDLSNADEDVDGSNSFAGLTALLSSVFGAVVENVDGSWFKITAADVKSFGNDQMSCVLENLKDAISSSSKGEIAKAYEKNPFLKVDKDAKVEEKDGIKYFRVSIDEGIQKKFSDEAKNIDGIKKLNACSTASESATESEESSATNEYTVGIKPWSHELASISGKSKVEGNDANISMKITYDKKSVSMPSNAKDIKEIETIVTNAMKTAMSSYVKSMCQAQYGTYGAAAVTACEDAAMESMEDIDFGSLFGSLNLGGSTSIGL